MCPSPSGWFPFRPMGVAAYNGKEKALDRILDTVSVLPCWMTGAPAPNIGSGKGNRKDESKRKSLQRWSWDWANARGMAINFVRCGRHRIQPNRHGDPTHRRGRQRAPPLNPRPTLPANRVWWGEYKTVNATRDTGRRLAHRPFSSPETTFDDTTLPLAWQTASSNSRLIRQLIRHGERFGYLRPAQVLIFVRR